MLISVCVARLCDDDNIFTCKLLRSLLRRSANLREKCLSRLGECTETYFPIFERHVSRVLRVFSFYFIYTLYIDITLYAFLLLVVVLLPTRSLHRQSTLPTPHLGMQSEVCRKNNDYYCQLHSSFHS